MSRMNDMAALNEQLTQDQIIELESAFTRADAAQREFETWNQEDIDRTIQAVAWSVANTATFRELVIMSIAESGLGDPSAARARSLRFAAFYAMRYAGRALESSKTAPRWVS